MNTIRTTKRNYHHGDLRAALIRAGLALLETREADDLGLREVARAVGVSAASVYRHFPDKEALLQALAEEGLQRLGEVQCAASDREGGGSAGFKAAGRAYVAFALANPALFRVIFSRAEPDAAAGAEEKDDEASRLLMEFASSVAGPDESATARLVATQAWALVHGLAVLILDKRLPNDPDLIAGVIDRGAPAPPKREQKD
jgi:AcrR family transcriptional regulator